MGHKNPKIILDECDFILHTREVSKTVWMCNKYFAGFTKNEGRCKAKLITQGKQVRVIGQHNHEPKVKVSRVKNCISRVVEIIRE